MQKIAELISEDITERIVEKLNEIEKSSNLSNLDISAILNKIPAVTSKEFVTDQNELWKDVSKLSVDFYLDFEYYKQFTFQSKFSCAEYHDALKNIGFKEINGFWKSYCKPSKTLVINYVVQSCIYRTIMMKMNEEDSVDEVMTINNTSELMDFCPFCDKNLNNVHNCEACSATAEEIENLRNQAKLIENKHNPSVGGGIEVVGNDLLCTEHVDSVNITGNSLIKNENSKSIPNINLINKQKINRGTPCGGVGKIALNQVSFVVPKITTIGENLKSWTCKYCGGLNDEEKMNCVVCMEDRTKLLCKYPKPRRKILPSKKFHENKANDNNNDDDNREKDGRTESWICWFGKCKERNDGNELYCKDCGLDKSASRERGATVDIMRYGKIEQVWICYACDQINDELNRSICYICGVSKFHVKDQLLDEYVAVAGDNDNNKCKCGNDRESLSCKQCESPRIEMWSCEHCTMLNQISDNYCAVCGKENVNKTIKYCSKCKQKEIICDDLCEDCLKAREEIWTCWYRFCESKNTGNVKYCKHCGLDRYADKINIGAPMWRCKGDVPDQIWICDKCSHINDISRYYCQNSQNYTCPGEKKYTKMCYKCEYKYNYESSNYCEMCKDKL